MFTSFKTWFLSKSLLMMLTFLIMNSTLVLSMNKIIFHLDMNTHTEIPFSMTFLLDNQSLIFISTVMMVSSLIITYSFYYLEQISPYLQKKFLFILLTFIFSMLILSLSANLFWLMVGWDGLGISSFCLIIFYQNWKSLGGGMVTFLSNRLGDTFIIISMIWIITNQSGDAWMFPQALTFVSFLTMIGAYSKSAQLPYLFWLPQAMAAPTPVSALVHSSTLVTAGIFLTCRFQPIQTNSKILFLFFLISCITVMIAGTSSLMEFDLKKIIALSTLCHISLMMMFSILGEINLSLFHLMMHAFFKSLLFMTAGLIIHENYNSQDIRFLSISKTDLKVSFPFLISILSMMGFPFLSGFYSKELLLMKSSTHLPSLLMLVMFLLNSFFSCAYSTRLVILLFSNQAKKILFFKKSQLSHILTISSILSSFMGGLMISSILPDEEMIQPSIVKILLLTFSILGVITGTKASTILHNPISNPISELWKSDFIYKIFQKHFFLFSNSLMWILDEKGMVKLMSIYSMNTIKYMFKNSTEILLKEPFSMIKLFNLLFLATFTWIL